MNVKTRLSLLRVCCVLSLVAVSAEASDDTSILPKNVVSAEVGSFSYANDSLTLTTTRAPNADVILSVAKQTRRLFRAPISDSISQLKIPSDCHWFYTLDDMDRLWLFVGPPRNVTPEKRRNYFAVYLYGHDIDENGKTHFSVQNVTGSKDGVKVIGTQQWQGVPEVFLTKLHQDIPDVPQVTALLPKRSPALTVEQVSQIVAANKE